MAASSPSIFSSKQPAAGSFSSATPFPRFPVSQELSIALYVRSTRPGVQLFGRVVLPSDVDPETKAPSYVLVPGTIFDQTDRWQRLELLDMMPSIERQARVLRTSTRAR